MANDLEKRLDDEMKVITEIQGGMRQALRDMKNACDGVAKITRFIKRNILKRLRMQESNGRRLADDTRYLRDEVTELRHDQAAMERKFQKLPETCTMGIMLREKVQGLERYRDEHARLHGEKQDLRMRTATLVISAIGAAGGLTGVLALLKAMGAI